MIYYGTNVGDFIDEIYPVLAQYYSDPFVLLLHRGSEFTSVEVSIIEHNIYEHLKGNQFEVLNKDLGAYQTLYINEYVYNFIQQYLPNSIHLIQLNMR